MTAALPAAMRAILFLVLLATPAYAQAPADPYPDTPTPAPSDPAPAPAAPAPAPAAPAPAPADPAPSPPPSQDPAPAASSEPAVRTVSAAQPPAPVVESGPRLTHVAPEDVPESCKALAKEAEAKSLNRALSARIAFASCIADAKLKPVALCDCEQSVIDVNAATQLPITLLDEVYAMGDVSLKILARQAKGDLLARLGQRLMATIPPATSEEAVALRNTRVDMLQPLIEPWQQQAQASFIEVDKLAKANPQLAKNPAIVAAVKSSRTHLGNATATATR